MGGHHEHNHSHTQNKKILLLSFILITLFMVIEAIGGVLTNSLALLSDAGHMLSDSISLGLALLAIIIAQRAATAAKTFGYKRIEILVSTINGLTLVGISIYILIEAVIRFTDPVEVQTTGMLVISTLGLIINIFVAVLMVKGGDTEGNLNMRGAYLHVLSDMLGSVGAIVAALCIIFFDWTYADPIASIIVAVLILRSGFYLSKSAIHVLMEHTPVGINAEEIGQFLRDKEGVDHVSDLHVWTVTSGFNCLTARIYVDGDKSIAHYSRLLKEMEHDLLHKNIQHVTLQFEMNSDHKASIWCEVESNPQHDHHHHH